MRLVTASLLLLTAGLLSAADSLLIGKWKYNPDKSAIKLPAQHVYWVSEAGGKVKYGIDLDSTDGSTKPAAAATLTLDGKEYPQTVNKAFDTVSFKTLGTRDWLSVSKLKGKEHSRGIWTVSLDGKMLIHVNDIPDAKTSNLARSVTIYDKQ